MFESGWKRHWVYPLWRITAVDQSEAVRIFQNDVYRFELSLMIELSQLVLKVGSCDVDDVLLNTLGCCLGYGLYRLLKWHRRVEKHVE